MSYILDALKKSEQARGGRKTHKWTKNLPGSLDWIPKVPDPQGACSIS